MVGRDYEVGKMPAPTPLRRWVDQQLIPMAIDGIASIEEVFQGLAQNAERRPLPMLGCAFAVGLAAALLVPRSTARRR